MKTSISIILYLFLISIASAQQAINKVYLKGNQFKEVRKSTLKEIQDYRVNKIKKSKKQLASVKFKIDENNKLFKLVGTDDVIQISQLQNPSLINDWEKSTLSYIETFTPIDVVGQERYIERVNTKNYISVIFFEKTKRYGDFNFILYKSTIDNSVYFITYLSDSASERKIKNMKQIITSLKNK